MKEGVSVEGSIKADFNGASSIQLRIADCGLRIEEGTTLLIPQSAIRNPQLIGVGLIENRYKAPD